MNDKRRLYLEEVTDQIQSKEAKKYISVELESHLKEAKDSFIKKGLNETEAEEKAICQMGSSWQLGKQLNKLHRPKVDWLMVFLMILIVSLSFLPIIALDNADMGSYTENKIIIVIIGIAVIFGLMFFDYKKLKKHTWLFFGTGMFILLLLHFFPSHYMNGYPIFEIGPITINGLSSIPFFFLFWASFFNTGKAKLWQATLIFFITSFMFLSIGGFSTFFIHSVMVFSMIWLSNIKSLKILGATLTAMFLVTIAGLAIWPFLEEYQLERLLSFLNPENFSDSSGYLYIRVKELMLSAGWFGNGIDQEFIPDSHTDFVFVNITYHFGWVLAGFLVVTLALVLARMLFTLKKIKDSYGKMLIIGGVTLFSTQFIYNIGMTLGFFPMISMSLPFVSYGLTPTLLNSIIIGIFLSVYRRKDLFFKTELT